MSKTTDTTTCPDPGIYYDVPERTYRAWPAANQSFLKDVVESPKKAKWRRDHPSKTTAAQLTGQVCHSAVFEPHLFDERYVARNKPPQRSDAVKAQWAAWEAEAAESGRTVISEDDYRLAASVRDAVRAHPIVGEMLLAPGHAEVSVVWDDDETGLRCKGRVDWLPKAGGTVVDLKTTRSAKPVAFGRSIIQYGYHVQEAFYRDGLFDVGAADLGFVFAAVEKFPPFEVVIFAIDESMREEGKRIYRDALRRYNDCIDTGYWPGYSDEIEVATLPEWAAREDDDDDGDVGF